MTTLTDLMDRLTKEPASRAASAIKAALCVLDGGEGKPPKPPVELTKELAETIVQEVLHDVVNLPDRTSPDDWPEAMLVTEKELKQILMEALLAERS
jgi:hypothetical protein